MKGDLDPAVSLIDEMEVTPAMIDRIATGKNLKVQDQVWILMQACSKFIDILDNIADEHHTAVETELLAETLHLVLAAAPEHEREKLRKYLIGETDGTELDGPSEAEPVSPL